MPSRTELPGDGPAPGYWPTLVQSDVVFPVQSCDQQRIQILISLTQYSVTWAKVSIRVMKSLMVRLLRAPPQFLHWPTERDSSGGRMNGSSYKRKKLGLMYLSRTVDMLY